MSPRSRRLHLGPAEPTLYVADVLTACVFFTETLGFEKVFTYGEPPFYGQVRRDDERINLRCVDPPVFVGDIREREQLLAVNIGVAEVDALYAEVQARGAPLFQALMLHPWGVRDFVVRDPDGNLIAFGHKPSTPG